MAKLKLIVMGASAGGVTALTEVIGHLPPDLPAAVVAVLHLNPDGRSLLPEILGRQSLLLVRHAKDGEPIVAGRVYVAPPDWHVAVQDGHIRLSHGPTENGHRPAVDVLFRTAARSFRSRALGVVLTGNLDDGTSGLGFIKQYGGTAIVQDPEEADYPGMPESAVQNVAVDHVLPLAGIAPLLDRLARNSVPEEADPAADAEESGDMRWDPEFEIEPGAQPSGLTCPACGGALWESQTAGPLHFRCRTGHAFSPESLSAEQTTAVEAALWAALRSLEENAALARGLAERMYRQGSSITNRFLRKAQIAERHAAQLRTLLHDKDTEIPQEPEEEPEPRQE
jgi:two-component system chemotaxis response regulator CheB